MEKWANRFTSKEMIGLNMEFILSEETGYWTYAQAKDLGGLLDVVLKLEYCQNEMYS